MEIKRAELKENQTYTFTEDVDLSMYHPNEYFIREIKDCHVAIKATQYETSLDISINIKAHLILPCAYTLEDVPYVVKGQETFLFVDDEEEADNENSFYDDKPVLDLTPFIYSVLIALTPTKVIKPGAKLPSSTSDYDVISEEEYLARKENQTDPRWDVLDNIEFDED